MRGAHRMQTGNHGTPKRTARRAARHTGRALPDHCVQTEARICYCPRRRRGLSLSSLCPRFCAVIVRFSFN